MSASEKFEKYTGEYTSDIYGAIRISEKNKNLVMSNGIRTVELKHLNGNIFSFRAPDILLSYFDRTEYVIFHKNDAGNFGKVYVSCFEEGETLFERK
jgi:hypothetical protein